MDKKETLKEMFNNKINKERIYQKTLLKLEKGNGKVKSFFKWSLVPSCLIIILVCIIFFEDNHQNLKISNPVSGVYINILNETDQVSADIDGRWVDKSIEELSEKFPFIEKINIQNDYIRIGEMYASSNINNPELYNQLSGYHLIYVVEEDISKTVDIFFSNTDKTRARCILYGLDSLTDSKIGNITLKIAKVGLYYIILFEKDGLYFDIEVNNVDEEELVMLLESIIE